LYLVFLQPDSYLDFVHETDCTAAEAVGTLLAMQQLS
jgi:hypothetical protein